jgi:hypothetical protein
MTKLGHVYPEAITELVRRGKDEFWSICRALGTNTNHEESRKVKRAIQKARRNGWIHYDKERRAWRVTQLGKQTLVIWP